MLMKFNNGNHDRNTFIRMTMTIKTLRVHTPTELNLSTPPNTLGRYGVCGVYSVWYGTVL